MTETTETRRAGGRNRASGEPSRAAGLTGNISETSTPVIRRAPRENHREAADDYRGELARLNDGFRVIVCKDGLQWIIQRRDGWTAGAPRWTGFRYHLTRDALIAACRASCAPCDPAALAMLATLPEKPGGPAA